MNMSTAGSSVSRSDPGPKTNSGESQSKYDGNDGIDFLHFGFLSAVSENKIHAHRVEARMNEGIPKRTAKGETHHKRRAFAPKYR